MLLLNGLTVAKGDITPEEFYAVVKKRIERVLIRTVCKNHSLFLFVLPFAYFKWVSNIHPYSSAQEGGSYQQRILSEYVKGIQSRAEEIVNALQGNSQWHWWMPFENLTHWILSNIFRYLNIFEPRSALHQKQLSQNVKKKTSSEKSKQIYMYLSVWNHLDSVRNHFDSAENWGTSSSNVSYSENLLLLFLLYICISLSISVVVLCSKN